jgi:hypothetical protein
MYLRNYRIGGREIRYIGVDLHTTNFVVCFLDEQERVTLQTFALTATGLVAFRRKITHEDRIAVEASPRVTFFYTHMWNTPSFGVSRGACYDVVA